MVNRTVSVMWLTALALALATLGLYWQTRTFEFIKFDDADYVISNKHVLAGLTPAGIRWAFSNRWSANWQPVTWLSHMADVSLFGVDSGAMHLVNASLHAVASGLLFLLLVQVLLPVSEKRGLASVPREAFPVYAAAFFSAAFWAVHPLRVESVAWVSSRKDVLSAFFCFLGLMAWLRDVRVAYSRSAPRYNGWNVFSDRRAVVGLRETGALKTFWLRCGMTGYGLAAMACFILGYMAKPTMMVFPAFAVLLEWLETGRVRWRTVVLFALIAAVFLFITVYAQEAAMSAIPMARRIGNAMEAMAIYLGQIVLPTRLSVFHPYLPMVWWRVILGVMAVIGMVVAGVSCFTRAPLVPCVIAWFGIGMLPVIGLVSVGSASYADRYTYLPTVGISVGFAVVVRRLLEKLADRRDIRDAFLSTLVVICLAYAVGAWRYVRVWQNTFLLAGHAVKSEPRNAWMWQWLGDEYINRFSDPDQAIGCYRKSLALNANPEIIGLLSVTLALRGAPGDLEEVKRLCAGFIGHEERDTLGASLSALAIVAMREMRWQEALGFFEEAFKRETQPKDFVRVWYGMCLYNVRRYAEAAQIFAETAEKTDDPDVQIEAQKRMRMAQEQIRMPLGSR